MKAKKPVSHNFLDVCPNLLAGLRILLSKDQLTTLFVEEIKLNIREASLLEIWCAVPSKL